MEHLKILQFQMQKVIDKLKTKLHLHIIHTILDVFQLHKAIHLINPIEMRKRVLKI